MNFFRYYKLIFLLSTTALHCNLSSQEKGDFFEKENLPVFKLEEVVIYGKPKLPDLQSIYKYYYLKEKVLKMHDHSVRLVKMMLKLNKRLRLTQSKKKKKRYIKLIQRYLKKNYTDSILNMTTTEGRVVCKLINRYSGKTVYEIVSHYQGGWSAFWWNTSAAIFDISLKEPYLPSKHEEDYHIEYILQEAFTDQSLIEFDPTSYIDTLNNNSS